ncbi:MAG: heavy metal translocating P-type ATPase, partial [Rhodobacteraceae bacterium]|nr:heavy metal translocating P-type ATPase [Paracoccaceae bacterium]
MTGQETDATERACEWGLTGMDCAACANKIRLAVSRLPGVEDVEVALMAERLRLRLTGGETAPEQVEQTVRALGYGIGPHDAAQRKSFVLPGGACGPDHGDHEHNHDHRRET